MSRAPDIARTSSAGGKVKVRAMERQVGVEPVTAVGSGSRLTLERAPRDAWPAGGAVEPVGASPGHEDDAQVALTGYLKLPNSKLSFAKDEESGRWFVKIVDAETGEVLRQVPPEELRQIAAALSRTRGLLINRSK
jgi:flagellar protein FlaG